MYAKDGKDVNATTMNALYIAKGVFQAPILINILLSPLGSHDVI